MKNKRFFFFFIFVVLIVTTLIHYLLLPPREKSNARTTCEIKARGDINCNGTIDFPDFEIWSKEYTRVLSTKEADLNNDLVVTIADFEIWRKGYTSPGDIITATPTSIILPSTVTPTTSVGTPIPTIPIEGSQSRGYHTTPQELKIIKQKATQGKEPYKAAVADLLSYVKDPNYWPFGTISGSQNCSATLEPQYIGEGNPLIYGKVIAYHLTGNSAYAENVREKLIDLTDTTGYGGETYSGGNQCILNLSWYLPAWIQAADLLEDYGGWSNGDKQKFQQWLADVIYRKTDWASDARANNWGTIGSATSGIIADYLTGSGLQLIDRTGAKFSPHDAYLDAKNRQLERIRGNSYMDFECPIKVYIRSDGGIGEELRRGSSGCNADHILAQDGSWSYTIGAISNMSMHAELLLRRGDRSLYDLVNSQGGSIQKAAHFVLNNPKGTQPWNINNASGLEYIYRYYRDAVFGSELGVGTGNRVVVGYQQRHSSWTTLTHGFASDESPGLPSTISPP